jgi:anti-anti-sigma factor
VTPLPRLHIDTYHVSPIAVSVAVVGEVDLATAPILRARLLEVMRDRAPAGIDVDLARVSFLDCAGLGALVGAYNAAIHIGCQLRVTHPSPLVHRIMALTGLLDILAAPTGLQPPAACALRKPDQARTRPAAAQPPDHRLPAAA